jgi:hypothetical protein
MNGDQVGVATITWARTDDEDTLLRRSLERLAAFGMPVAIGDAGTRPSFTAFLERLPGVTVSVPAARGLVPQVQASVAIASTFDNPYTFYVEPDKELFFAGPMADFLRRAPDAPDVGAVIASRSDRSLATFPPMQRYTEGVINHLCGERFGVAGDYSYGPFLIARRLLPAISALDAALGWGWRHAAFAATVRSGLRLALISGEYDCPPDQRIEDQAERAHRVRQLSENIRGLLAVPDPAA